MCPLTIIHVDRYNIESYVLSLFRYPNEQKSNFSVSFDMITAMCCHVSIYFFRHKFTNCKSGFFMLVVFPLSNNMCGYLMHGYVIYHAKVLIFFYHTHESNLRSVNLCA